MTRTKKTASLTSVKVVKKSVYRRSTPVVRLQRNVQKIARHAELCRDRLEVWSSSGNSIVALALVTVAEVEKQVAKLDGHVGELDRTAFVPPPRTPTWQPAKGDVARVADDHRQKFEEIYESVLKEDPAMLDELVVVRTLSTGEVVVQRGKRLPFPIRKSHLVLVRSAG